MATKGDNKKRKRFIRDNVFNIILIVLSTIMIGITLVISSGLQDYKKAVVTEQENYNRSYIRHDLENAKDSLEFYLSHNNPGGDEETILTEEKVMEWALTPNSDLIFGDGVTHSYLLSTQDGKILYDNSKGVSKLDLKTLKFYSNNNKNDFHSIEELVYSYNNTGPYSHWYAVDEEGNHYLAEWVYSPTTQRGYDGEKFIVNGCINENTEGVIFLALSNASFFEYKINTTMTYINNAQKMLIYFTGTCILILSVTFVYILYMERRVDYINDVLKKERKEHERIKDINQN